MDGYGWQYSSINPLKNCNSPRMTDLITQRIEPYGAARGSISCLTDRTNYISFDNVGVKCIEECSFHVIKSVDNTGENNASQLCAIHGSLTQIELFEYSAYSNCVSDRFDYSTNC